MSDRKLAKHRHHFTVSYWSGENVGFCCRCGEHTERKMTNEERARFKHEHVWQPRAVDDVHRVFHDFARQFAKRDGNGYKFVSYDFMQRVGRWAKRWPKDVRLVGCDDGAHASSLLVLIEHRAKNAYMGTTVVFIPQCTGGPPTEFFLYPPARGDLMAALVEIRQESKPRERRERAIEKARGKWWAKVRP